MSQCETICPICGSRCFLPKNHGNEHKCPIHYARNKKMYEILENSIKYDKIIQKCDICSKITNPIIEYENKKYCSECFYRKLMGYTDEGK